MILILCPCYPSTAIYGHHDGDWRGYSSTASYIYTSGIRNWMTSSCPHDLHISPHVQIIWPIRSSLFLRRCPALSPVANACLNNVACMLPVFCPTNLVAAHCNVYTSLLRYSHYSRNRPFLVSDSKQLGYRPLSLYTKKIKMKIHSWFKDKVGST